MGPRLLALAALASVAAGCEKRSTKYCGMHPDDLANCEQTDAPPPAKVMCEMDSHCSPPHCEPKAHVCVECLSNDHCDNDELCDVNGSYTCRGCIVEDDCPSLTCLPNGTCADEGDVLYVDGAGDDATTCTRSQPCKTITRALTQRTETRSLIRVSGEISDSPVIKTDVEIFASPGAKLVGIDETDWVIKIQTAVVKVHGLVIFCLGAGDQTGVKTEMDSTTTLDQVEIYGCGREGAVEMKGGVTIVTRSNLHDNPAGAINTDGNANFAVTNNFIHHNGGTGKPAVNIGASSVRPETRFEFNTLMDNPTALTAALTCTKATVTPNNILARNGALAMAVSTCAATGSLITDDVTALDMPDNASADYHLGSASIAKDTAPDGSSVDDDVDGEFRPLGPAKDYGADEYRP
jgi:hypothetical protein